MVQQCVKLEDTKVSEQQPIVIRITSNRLIKGSFFSRNYIEYEVATDGLGWLVNRRYSDFDLLNQTLHKLFPGVVLPALPKKNWKKNLDEYHVNKRQYNLQKYINQVANHPLLSRAYCVLDFLKVDDSKTWDAGKTQMKRVKKVNNIGNTYSLDGSQKMSIKQDQEQYMKQFNQHLYQTAPSLKRVQCYSKQLYLAFDTISNILETMSNEFDTLHKNTIEFNNNQIDGQKMNNSCEIYSILKDQHMEWSQQMETQMELVQYQYMFFYGHIRKNSQMMQHYYDEKSVLAEQLLNKQKKLLKTKQKLFDQGQVSKWKLGHFDGDVEELKKDKNKAIELMLPQVKWILDDRKRTDWII